MKIFKNLFGISSEEDEELEEREEKKPAPVTEIGSRTGRQRVETGANLSGFPDFTPPAGAAAGATPIDNVVATYRMNVVVIEPQSFDDAQQVAVNLQKKKPVVLNFEKERREPHHRLHQRNDIRTQRRHQEDQQQCHPLCAEQRQRQLLRG